MNVTLLGKLLVLLVVVLSLGLCTFAIGVSTNRIDWPGTGAPAIPGAKSTGELARLKGEVDEAQKAVVLAVGRCDDAAQVLARREARVPKDRQYYARQLEILEGKDAAGNPVNDPIQVLVPAKGGPDADGLPVLEARAPARPLESRRAAKEELARLDQEIAKQMAAVKDLIAREKSVTVEINGVKGEQKGWRDLLAEETGAHEKALAEIEAVRPLRYNRQVEAAILAQRQAALQARLNDLRKVGVALQDR